jgi:hypothetical protein
MGYTHYFSRNSYSNNPVLFAEFARGARKIIAFAVGKDEGIKLTDGTGAINYDRAVGSDEVWFNGVGDEAHEAFNWEAVGNGFNFVKTARKPYDAVVTAVLIHLKDVYRDAVEISSDGDWSEWSAGVTIYEKALNKKAVRPFTSELVS